MFYLNKKFGLDASETKTSLLSYRDQLEYQNFTCSKRSYYSLRNMNDADQTARMRGWPASLLFAYNKVSVSRVDDTGKKGRDVQYIENEKQRLIRI